MTNVIDAAEQQRQQETIAPATVDDLLYAVSRDEDGTIELTVYEEGRACCVVLNRQMALDLAELLTAGHTQ
jgi:hypothetical protein